MSLAIYSAKLTSVIKIGCIRSVLLSLLRTAPAWATVLQQQKLKIYHLWENLTNTEFHLSYVLG